VTQLENAEFQTTDFVLNPADAEAIALLKSTTNEYIVGSPGGSAPPTLWNLPVVVTNSQTAGTFRVGDFQMAALLFDRQDPRLDVSLDDDKNFQQNLG
jgi:HK97 family phage major capsid protein